MTIIDNSRRQSSWVKIFCLKVHKVITKRPLCLLHVLVLLEPKQLTLPKFVFPFIATDKNYLPIRLTVKFPIEIVIESKIMISVITLTIML